MEAISIARVQRKYMAFLRLVELQEKRVNPWVFVPCLTASSPEKFMQVRTMRGE